jgi:hypothetical protein
VVVVRVDQQYPNALAAKFLGCGDAGESGPDHNDLI